VTTVADTTAAPTAVVRIPNSHRDLFERPVCGVLTTLGPEGAPESSLVWVALDGDEPTVNTTFERRKARNVCSHRQVSLLVVDPDDTSRFIQVRGDASLETAGALADLDALTRRYTAHPRFYGFVYPVEQAERETRVILRIRPTRVTLDAIHAGTTAPRAERRAASSEVGPTGPPRRSRWLSPRSN
jgi:PPOX class probable F420-dependent enzyme